MNKPTHPIWEIARIAVWGAIVIGVLFVTASQFDETEIKAWSLILGGGGAASMGINWIQKRSEKDE